MRLILVKCKFWNTFPCQTRIYSTSKFKPHHRTRDQLCEIFLFKTKQKRQTDVKQKQSNRKHKRSVVWLTVDWLEEELCQWKIIHRRCIFFVQFRCIFSQKIIFKEIKSKIYDIFLYLQREKNRGNTNIFDEAGFT